MKRRNDTDPRGAADRLKGIKSFLKKRHLVLDALRDEFSRWGFWEVETPLRIEAPAPELNIEAEPSGSLEGVT